MSQLNHRKYRRPVPMGTSISHYRVTAGTAGMVVYKDGQTFILTNNHVGFLSYEGGKKGDLVIAPGRVDIPRERRKNLENFKIGEAWEAIDIKPLPVENLVDACLVKVEDKDVLKKQLGIEEIKTKVVRVKPGDIVIKSSRTSGVNEGRVLATGVLARIWFTIDGKRQVVHFKDQVFLSQKPPFTRGGDSGSAVFLKGTKEICGKIFAGSVRVGVMNNFDNVQKLIGFTFEQPQNYKLEIIKAIKEIIILLKRIVHLLGKKGPVERRS